jgi:hypothetical protein
MKILEIITVENIASIKLDMDLSMSSLPFS